MGVGVGFFRFIFINTCVGLQHALRVVQFLHMSYGKIRPHTHIYIYIIHTNIYKYIPKLYPQTWSAKDDVTKFVLGASAQPIEKFRLKEHNLGARGISYFKPFHITP